MATLPELRAELTRLQAQRLQVDQELNAAAPGTDQYGQLQRRRQQVGLAVDQAGERLKAAVQAAGKGAQPSLL